MRSHCLTLLATVGTAIAVPLATTTSSAAYIIDTPAAIFSSLQAYNMSRWASSIAATATETNPGTLISTVTTASATLILADSPDVPEWQVPSNAWSSWLAKQTVKTVTSAVAVREAAPATTAAPSASSTFISTLASGSATLIIADSPTMPEWQVPSNVWSAWLAKQTVQTVSTAVAKRAAATPTTLIVTDSPDTPEWQVPTAVWESWLAKQTVQTVTSAVA